MFNVNVLEIKSWVKPRDIGGVLSLLYMLMVLRKSGTQTILLILKETLLSDLIQIIWIIRFHIREDHRHNLISTSDRAAKVTTNQLDSEAHMFPNIFTARQLPAVHNSMRHVPIYLLYPC